MERLSGFSFNDRFEKLFVVAAILLGVLLPVGLSFKNVAHEKQEIKNAGVWLRDHRDMNNSKIIVSDERIAFYAGLYRGAYDTFPESNINSFIQNTDNIYDIIVLYNNRDDGTEIYKIENYKIVETFSGRKKDARIYEKIL